MLKRCFLIVLCAIMLLSIAACGKVDIEVSEPEESYPEGYVLDEAVNRFILDFKHDQSRYVMAGLGQLSGTNTYVAYLDIAEIRMTSTKYGLHLEILGNRTVKSRDRIIDIFATVAKVADSSCSDQQINAARHFMLAQTETSDEYRVSNYIRLLSYTPLVVEGSVELDCKIDLMLLNYLPQS